MQGSTVMHQSHAGTLAPEEPDELIAHVRVCGGAGWVTTGSTRKRFTACKAAFLATSFLKDTRTYILWGYGDTGKTLRQALLAHGKVPSHIVEIHPGRLGNRIHNAPVIRPEDLVRVPRSRVVVSVAGVQARQEIRQVMGLLGFVELRDFVCAA
jgi:hypothetical protein